MQKTFKNIILFLLLFTTTTNAVFAQDQIIDSLKALLSNAKEDSTKAKLNNDLALKYYMTNYEKTIEHGNVALEIANKINDSTEIGRSYKVIGIGYYIQGDYPTALKHYYQALEIAEKIDDQKNILSLSNNIGLILIKLMKYEEGLAKFKVAAEMLSKTDNYKAYAKVLHNMGTIYDLWDSTKTALALYNKSLKIRKENDLRGGIGTSLNNIAFVYFKQKNYEKATPIFIEAIQYLEETEQYYPLVSVYLNLARIYGETQKHQQAYQYIQKAEVIAKQIDAKEKLSEVYKGYFEYFYSKNDYKNALINYLKADTINDTLYMEETTREIAEMNAKYQTEKKEKENAQLRANEAKANAEIARQKLVIYTAIAVVAGIVFLLIIILRSRNVQKRLNNELTIKNSEISQQTEEIKTQNEELTTQKEHISKQAHILELANKEINQQQKELNKVHNDLKASINYAARIQNAAMQGEKLLKSEFADYFLIYKPRNIVSGDFYWINKIDKHIIVAVADCTGHGVPGAFVSMLGISLLNEIIHRKEITQANQVLEELRIRVKKSLHQEQDANQRDGMDIALCGIDTETYELQFAGAYNPLYIIKNTKFSEIKADRMPIGLGIKEHPFKNNTLKLEKGDKLFMFSDGIQDQFNQEGKEKFKTRRLKQIITETSAQPMHKQKQTIENTYQNWKGTAKQIDDVILLGLEIK